MKKIIASLAFFWLVLFGLASNAGACFWLFYQAEMPQKPQEYRNKD